MPLLVGGVIALPLASCTNPVNSVGTANSNIAELADRSLAGIAAAQSAFVRPPDSPPPTPEEVEAGALGLKSAAQATRDIKLETQKITDAIPDLQARESELLRTIRLGLYSLLLIGTLVGLWYLGVGALVGRLVRFIAYMIPQVIPRKIEEQAKLDAEALSQAKASNAVEAADTLGSTIAIRRSRSPLYEAAFQRHKEGKK